LGDTARGPHLAKTLVSSVRRLNLEDSDSGRFANNQLTVFAYLLRERSDYSAALRLDQPALNYLDRMGGVPDDEYAFVVAALARDYEGLGDRARAIEILQSYKERIDSKRGWTAKERAAVTELRIYQRKAIREATHSHKVPEA
jgi:tetratricopeptide (TPR) repeat protein